MCQSPQHRGNNTTKRTQTHPLVYIEYIFKLLHIKNQYLRVVDDTGMPQACLTFILEPQSIDNHVLKYLQ